MQPEMTQANLLRDHNSNPVHFSGLIQPHGMLLAIDPATWTIHRASANVENWFGCASDDILGQPLSCILAEEQVSQFQQTLNQTPEIIECTQLAIDASGQSISVHAILHQTSNEVILELERFIPIESDQVLLERGLLRKAINRLQQITDVDQFLDAAVHELAQMTGFDHVMVYQFDTQKAGKVIAEAAAPDVDTYLGLHFPATDIPEGARQLYQTGVVRFCPDIHAVAIEIIDLADDAQPVDLSRSILRSVDSCCVAYHQNMNVQAFLVFALIKDQKLWGLLSCHNTSPKMLSYSMRSDCQILSQFISAELGNKVSQSEFNYVKHLNSILSDFVESIVTAKNFKQALIQPQERLLDLVSANGAAVCLDGEVTLLGQTPSLEQVEALINWSDSNVKTNLFETQHLARFYPPAEAYQSVASGLMLLKISQIRQYCILWFRPEVLQTVTWAGNPEDNFTTDADGTIELHPRSSFEAWQSTVQGTSLRWQTAELDNAVDLRNAIIGIVLNKADELAQINLDLERSNQELASFAYAASHDLKEPLRGIHNFSNLLLKRYGNVLDEAGVKRLHTLVRLTQRMDILIDSLLKISRLGQTELTREPTDIQAVVEKVIEVLQASRSTETAQADIQIPRPLPTIDCDATLISEVFTNLLSNALKYNDKPQPLIEIGYVNPDERADLDLPSQVQASPESVILYVRDNGIGIRERHLHNIFQLFKRLHERDAYGGGAGAGLTITKKIIERHQGNIWVKSRYGQATEFAFMLT